jgi:hypothetical protein
LAIVLSVVLRYTDSDYAFGIFKLVATLTFSCWLQEEFEDTKGVIRICISKKNRQRNGQKKKYKTLLLELGTVPTM